ncbi:MAG: hypothetical protein ABIH34_08445 [Nanoarchaeota archaeon]
MFPWIPRSLTYIFISTFVFSIISVVGFIFVINHHPAFNNTLLPPPNAYLEAGIEASDLTISSASNQISFTLQNRKGLNITVHNIAFIHPSMSHCSLDSSKDGHFIPNGHGLMITLAGSESFPCTINSFDGTINGTINMTWRFSNEDHIRTTQGVFSYPSPFPHAS